jgi:hypothetical protein
MNLKQLFVLSVLFLPLSVRAQTSTLDNPADAPIEVATPSPDIACIPVPSGAVAWWRAESNTVDSIGINDGLLQTGRFGTTPYTTGKVGQAFFFPGTIIPIPPLGGATNYIFVPPSADLDLGQGAGLTVEGWIKPNSLSGVQPIIEWNDGHENIGAGLALNGSALQGYLAKTNPLPIRRIVFSSSSGLITTQAWQHVALTWDKDSGLATIYLNGSSVGQTNLGVFAPQTHAPVYIAFRQTGMSPRTFYVGGIDEMTIYNRALTQAEIQAIIAADTAGKCAPSPPACVSPPANIVGWWRGESNAVDSVDGNNGTIVDTVSYGQGAVGAGFVFLQGYVLISASSNLNVGAGSGLSIEMWAVPQRQTVFPAPAVPREFVGWHNGAVTQGVNISVSASDTPLSSDVVGANIVDIQRNSHAVLSPAGVVKAEVWQHFAVTYDKMSGIAALYVNGNSVTQANWGTFTPLTTGDLRLGYRLSSGLPLPPSQSSSALDEVSIYARALSPSEIRAIMLSRGTGRCKEPPAIKSQPVSVRVNLGDTVMFSVMASGNPNLRYQWRRGGTNLSGATTTSLTITNVQLAQAASYSVRVTNAFGTIVSSNAVLTVNRSPTADASATAPLVVVPPNCNPTIVLDGSRSSDPDGDPLHFFWFQNGAATPLATGAVAVVTLPFGENSLFLSVDDGLATNTQSFTVQVITPGEAVQELMDLVNAEASKPNPLNASLRAALKSIDRGNTTPAINQLQAFEHKVSAQVSGDDPALADNFTHAAEQIIDILNADCLGEKPHGHIGKISHNSQGKPQIQFTAPAGFVYIIEASTNLVDWEKIGVATNAGAADFQFEDPSGGVTPSRFYRIVAP